MMRGLLRCLLLAGGFIAAGLAPEAAPAWSLFPHAQDQLVEQHGQYLLKRPFADYYDTAFVWTDAGARPPRVVGLGELAEALQGYDVVFYGESHGHPGVHLQQQQLFRAMYERAPQLILSFEQFERDVQGLVDDYLAGRVGETTLKEQGRAWDNYAASYRPLLTFAREHQLPVIAAEAPGWSISCVGQWGPGILEQFTPEERAWVARDLHLTPGAYRDKFMGFQSGSATHGGGGELTPEALARAERSFAAQALRDDTMAESILLALQRNPGRRVLHLTGNFHSSGFLGTVERLRLRDPKLRIAVIEPVEVADPEAPSFARGQVADATVLQLIYPNPESFAPGEDSSAWVMGIIAKRKANACKYSLPAAHEPTVAPTAAPVAPGRAIVHHDLKAQIEPATHHISVHDRLEVPAALATPELRLLLNAELKAIATTPGLSLALVERSVVPAEPDSERIANANDSAAAAVRVNVYRVRGLRPGKALTLALAYQGRINYPVRESATHYARSSSESPGLIEPRGVYLAGSTYWVAQVPGTAVTYRLATVLPPGWKSVSEGTRADLPAAAGRAPGAAWEVATPTEAIHLIAARFTVYQRTAGSVHAYAYLRGADAALADRYLDATARYLAMYAALLGDYPYGKFALVENFWETGYGMPSFTLLGERIIRLPFIINTSYPHELLHNWWGNGVFVDYSGGNWCEGLTAYLADHLVAEQGGRGVEHRRDILRRASDYVTPQNDFPLSQFLGRRDALTEAIGYGKAAMVWNMLRVRVGDQQFLASLRRFYRDQLFRTASFADLRRSFEAETGQDLGSFFSQWVTQPGLPELHLDSSERAGSELTVTVSQRQPTPALALDIPVAIQTAAGATLRTLSMSAGQASVTGHFALDAPATGVAIDPQFQLYRRLDALESPPALSQAFASARVLIVLPASGSGQYAGLAAAWRRDGVEITTDAELAVLPDDRAVWIVGTSNRHASEMSAALRGYDAQLDRDGLRVAANTFAAATSSIVAVAREPGSSQSVRVFLSAPTAAAATALAHKLPHYGKYSWLVFSGEAPDLVASGEWPATHSPLARQFDAGDAPMRLPQRAALAPAM